MGNSIKERPEPDIDVPEGNPKRGAKIFKRKCGKCHTIEEGGEVNHGIPKHGPPLWGLTGRQSGTYAGYAYSEANKNSGIIWSDKHLFEYIRDPRKYIPGTKMHTAGLKKEKERADLVAFMRDMN
eukprot:TRINITY_DN68588_c0_g1_i1.p2 TRINITY_DN68588_c0_g1~~TRINITY_DN68588_c0_g1_i1.p2  ORF type:complete len:125 (+),score=23.03 TRINITY_DN68588_c0_g1_i1:178-552(+)